MSAPSRGYWFRSPLFQVEPCEDDETNPGRYGRQLALWLADRLRERGTKVESVTPEDWGWRVACRSGPHRLIAACGNVDLAGPGEGDIDPTASAIWHCFPVCESSLWRRLLRPGDAALALETFDGTLREIFEREPRVELTDEP